MTAIDGMTPDEYRAALKKLRVSQRGARHVLGIDERTSRRYASDGPIPKPIALLLKALLDLRRRQQQLP